MWRVLQGVEVGGRANNSNLTPSSIPVANHYGILCCDLATLVLMPVGGHTKEKINISADLFLGAWWPSQQYEHLHAHQHLSSKLHCLNVILFFKRPSCSPEGILASHYLSLNGTVLACSNKLSKNAPKKKKKSLPAD